MFCSLEKLKIGMSASLLLGMFLTAHGEYLHSGLKSDYLLFKGKDVNWGECANSICATDAINCHFAHTDSKECYQINLPLRLLLKWCPEKILIKDENMTIYYFYSDGADILTEKPRVWWLYDNVSKGRNFGTAGPALDIPVGSVVWKNESTGPGAGSPLLYAEGKYEKVALKHNGTLLLDMGAEFTISMWIKTAGENKHMWLLGGSPMQTARFEFWPSPDGSQLALAFNAEGDQQFYTKKINTKVDDWRHVAVVYRSRTSPTFFLNGDVWPLEHYSRVTSGTTPTHLAMWNSSPGGKNDFRGQIACVMFFEAALSQPQIRILKNNCP